MQSYIKNRVKLWDQIEFQDILEISIYCLPRNFTDFRCILQCSFTEMKSTSLKLQNESLPKDIGQELLIVNNSV